MDLMLKPVRIATSKPARQTYLNTVLLMTTSTILLLVAAICYILFYMNYIPQIGIERDVHLQFGNGPNPYAFINLDNTLTSQQPYSVHLVLSLPRSPTNLHVGNFMLDLALLSPSYKPTIALAGLTPPFLGRSTIPDDAVLYSSRRPALIAYFPPIITYTKQFFSLPLYLLKFRKRDAEVLSVSMAESVSFSRGWRNVPNTIYLEVQGPGQAIQIYDMHVKLRARFEGLRWIMYNHRITSFIVFTGAFWAAEVIFAVLTWLLWSTRSSTPASGATLVKKEKDGGSEVKKEEADGTETDDVDLSDTPRSFPTYGRQAPLRYNVPAMIKKEEAEEEENILESVHVQPLEADDESEEIVNVGGYAHRGRGSDSGIGTSFSEGGGLGGIARRKR